MHIFNDVEKPIIKNIKAMQYGLSSKSWMDVGKNNMVPTHSKMGMH